MADLLARLLRVGWVAHLVRAVGHYVSRLGFQFGAAVTYFSVLALLPSLLIGFAALGFVLTVLRPDLIDVVAAAVATGIGASSGETNARLAALLESSLRNYAAVGLTGLAFGVYFGSDWVANLKYAVRTQWRPEPDLRPPQQNLLVATLVNLAVLLGLLALVLVTFGLAAVGTSLTDSVLVWLGLERLGLAPLLRLVPLVFSVAAGWVLFVYLYRVLPETRAPWPVLWRGALLGAVGLAGLQYGTGALFALFSQNAAALLFGPVIALMLFFNLFAQLILFVAAWIATAPITAGDGATGHLDLEGRTEPPAPPQLPAELPEQRPTVPQEVAVRSARLGLGAGYLTGAATGLGLGALLAAAVVRVLPSRADRSRRGGR